ncbi:MAG: rhodanese-like domain-containing protein [Alphaproteobacteria bacterium]|nr:rhodanese-like domain-containing protein [Alphaproteobacteria bacterium]
MQFILDNWMLISVALASGFLLFLPIIQGASSSGLTVIETVQKINREKAVVIDVCTDAEFNAGHVPGAKHIPLSELNDRLPVVARDKNLPLILVCASGMRSRSAVAVAKKLGYTQALSLTGGLKAWREASQPVLKS